MKLISCWVLLHDDHAGVVSILLFLTWHESKRTKWFPSIQSFWYHGRNCTLSNIVVTFNFMTKWYTTWGKPSCSCFIYEGNHGTCQLTYWDSTRYISCLVKDCFLKTQTLVFKMFWYLWSTNRFELILTFLWLQSCFPAVECVSMFISAPLWQMIWVRAEEAAGKE